MSVLLHYAHIAVSTGKKFFALVFFFLCLAVKELCAAGAGSADIQYFDSHLRCGVPGEARRRGGLRRLRVQRDCRRAEARAAVSLIGLLAV